MDNQVSELESRNLTMVTDKIIEQTRTIPLMTVNCHTSCSNNSAVLTMHNETPKPEKKTSSQQQ